MHINQLDISDQIMSAVPILLGVFSLYLIMVVQGRHILWKYIIAALRVDDHTVLAIASSGVPCFCCQAVGQLARCRIQYEINKLSCVTFLEALI
jgi:hypothetical protein